jgi:hypothetical protein
MPLDGTAWGKVSKKIDGVARSAHAVKEQKIRIRPS